VVEERAGTAQKPSLALNPGGDHADLVAEGFSGIPGAGIIAEYLRRGARHMVPTSGDFAARTSMRSRDLGAPADGRVQPPKVLEAAPSGTGW